MADTGVGQSGAVALVPARRWREQDTEAVTILLQITVEQTVWEKVHRASCVTARWDSMQQVGLKFIRLKMLTIYLLLLCRCYIMHSKLSS